MPSILPRAVLVASTLALAALVADASDSRCSLSVDGAASDLPHVLALAIPAPFDEGQRLTRLVCTERALPDDALHDEVAFVSALHADGQRGFLLDIEPDGDVVSARLSWGDLSTMWSSAGLEEIRLDGSAGPDRLVGSVATTTPLSAFRRTETWSVAAVLDLDVIAGW